MDTFLNMTFSFFQKQMFQERSGRMIQAFSPSCSPSSSPPREFSPSRSPSPPSRWAMPRTSPPSSPKGASASISSMSEGDEDEKWGNITHIIDCTLPTNSHTLAAMTGQLPSWENFKYCTQHRVVEVLFSYAGITANIWKPSQPWTDPERRGDSLNQLQPLFLFHCVFSLHILFVVLAPKSIKKRTSTGVSNIGIIMFIGRYIYVFMLEQLFRFAYFYI